MGIEIAIDGPSGSGKSTVAKGLAQALGFVYIDTGAMYRAVAVGAMRRSIDLSDGVALRDFSKSRKIRFAYEEGEVLPSRVYFGDEEMTDYIRTPEVDGAVSLVAGCPELRGDMLAKQRMLGSKGNYVVEGRDIGSVVFPNAALKIFLTACVEERARRRSLQNEARGLSSDFEKTLQALKVRDEKDFNREIAPLMIAEDAVELDTTDMNEDEVIQAIVDLATKVRDRVCGPDGGASDDNCRGLPEIGDEYA